MFEFIRIQYILGRLSAVAVLGMAPKYITVEQANQIINETNA